MRRNVWIPDALWRRIQRAAAREGAERGETVSAAEYIREAVEARLDADEREERRAS